MRFQRRGVMLVLASPSGAGKTSISRTILQKFDNISLSVSVTTRPRRPSEVDGMHYHFIDKRRFERMRASDDLLEWAEVHGNFYGTPRADVEEKLAAGHDILFDIDWQGTQQLYEKCRADMVHDLRPAAHRSRRSSAPRTPGPGQRRSHRPAPQECPRSRWSTGRNTTTC